MGNCSYFQNDLEQAIQYINKGLEAYDESKEREQIKYNLFSNKIFYLINSSRSDEAFLILNEIWPLRSKIDKNNGALLDLYTFRASLFRDRGMNEEAIQVCEEGLKIAKSVRRRNRYLDLLTILGSIHLYQKDFDTAYDRFHLVLTLDSDFKHPRRHVEAHTWLGILHNSKKEWNLAREHLEKAIQISRETPNVLSCAKALIAMGNLYAFQEQYAEAIPFYQEAADLCEKRYKHRQYTALLKKAYCFVKMGKTDDADFVDCLKTKLDLEIILRLKSEDEVYEIL
ncbi:tetratricopeptide repeat protein [Lihuaxuella thermophila]|uniref:Tetratricopeptide repeat-containing protein n=1 Tax=Lihuaxuella thermophila TaxID=1173111 RepID=A0A1H8J208_9BACL|nr:tetratricopeptide repeat protein [Lihuaxuella thermophila]SEN74762.1 Tetratricopeptide repeat-containing protein [Lihuaxuella thermophila]